MSICDIIFNIRLSTVALLCSGHSAHCQHWKCNAQIIQAAYNLSVAIRLTVVEKLHR